MVSLLYFFIASLKIFEPQFENDNHCLAVMRKPEPKKYGNELHPHDRTWLLMHTSWQWDSLDKMFKAFKDEYPKGGIFRRQEHGLIDKVSLQLLFNV